MLKPIQFYPECHVDTALTRALLYDRQKFVTHIKGVPNVGNALHEQAEKHGDSRVVVGLVDNDKKLFDIKKLQPFRQTVVMRCAEKNCEFAVYQHAELACYYLVVLDPACDGWLYGAATAAGINPAAHGLPPTLAEFLAFTKRTQAEDRPEIVALLKALRRSPPPAFQQLAEFVAACLQEAGHERHW